MDPFGLSLLWLLFLRRGGPSPAAIVSPPSASKPARPLMRLVFQVVNDARANFVLESLEAAGTVKKLNLFDGKNVDVMWSPKHAGVDVKGLMKALTFQSGVRFVRGFDRPPYRLPTRKDLA